MFVLDASVTAWSYADLTFSPDGLWVAYISNLSGHLNIFKQRVTLDPVDAGEPIQLTFLEDEAPSRVMWSSDGSQLLVFADRQGNENFQIYSLSPEGGELEPITRQADVCHGVGSAHGTDGDAFSPDGKRIAYSRNERDPKDRAVLLLELETDEVRTLLEGEGRCSPFSWSPDGRFVLIQRVNRIMDQDLFLCDTHGMHVHHVTLHADDIRFYPGPWSPDSLGFYLLTDHNRPFRGLAYLDLDEYQVHSIDVLDHDVEDVALSRDGRYLAWVVNEDGYSTLRVGDQQTGEVRQYPELPKGVFATPIVLTQTLRFSPTEPVLGFYIASPAQPANLYLLNVETRQFRRVTESFPGKISVVETQAGR